MIWRFFLETVGSPSKILRILRLRPQPKCIIHSPTRRTWRGAPLLHIHRARIICVVQILQPFGKWWCIARCFSNLIVLTMVLQYWCHTTHQPVNMIPLHALQCTEIIWVHASTLQTFMGIDLHELSAHFSHAGGTMALLTVGCNSNIIKLLGWWESNAMMDYLHQQSLPLFCCLTSLMFNNGNHTFLPVETVPSTD